MEREGLADEEAEGGPSGGNQAEGTSVDIATEASERGKSLIKIQIGDEGNLLQKLEVPLDYTDEFHEGLADLHDAKGIRSSEQLMILQVLVDYRRLRDHFLQ